MESGGGLVESGVVWWRSGVVWWRLGFVLHEHELKTHLDL